MATLWNVGGLGRNVKVAVGIESGDPNIGNHLVAIVFVAVKTSDTSLEM